MDEEVSGLHPLHTGKINKASTKSNETILIKFFIFVAPNVFPDHFLLSSDTVDGKCYLYVNIW